MAKGKKNSASGCLIGALGFAGGAALGYFIGDAIGMELVNTFFYSKHSTLDSAVPTYVVSHLAYYMILGSCIMSGATGGSRLGAYIGNSMQEK